MGCSSSKQDQPKGSKPQESKKVQEAKKVEKPQEAKKVEEPKKAEKPQEPKAEPKAPAQAAAEPPAAAPAVVVVEPVASAPKEESAPASVDDSPRASAEVPEKGSVKPSTASVHEVTPAPSERATSPPPPPEAAPAPAGARATVPQLQMGDAAPAANRAGQTPRGERSISPRRYPVEVAIRRESVGRSPSARRVEETCYTGPGPVTNFPIESVYRCFDEGNGLLFRLVNDTRHTWAFYNDTEVYTMHVTVSFGHESMVRALGSTTQVVHDEETGHCTLEVDVAPGETQPFMRGEFNGFVTYYDADPIPYDLRKK